MPISVGDSRTFHKAVMATSMAEVMQFCQRGMMDYTFLSGAQIDPYGNLNSTHIGGTHQKPKVRLPGSGGACDLASFCWRTLIIMRHDPKKFVEKLDFLTTPGYLTGPGAREAAGLPRGSGPHRVITELAVLDFHPGSRRMRLLSLHPGVSLEQVHAATGFRLDDGDSPVETIPPTGEELRILREEVDPAGYILRRGG
jgi:glutaconate CoA-transferase subunit B